CRRDSTNTWGTVHPTATRPSQTLCDQRRRKTPLASAGASRPLSTGCKATCALLEHRRAGAVAKQHIIGETYLTPDFRAASGSIERSAPATHLCTSGSGSLRAATSAGTACFGAG